MIRVAEIKVSIDADEDKLKTEILRKLKIKEEELVNFWIYKKSLDARKKDQIAFVYTLDVELKKEKEFLKKYKGQHVSPTPDMEYRFVEVGKASLAMPPVVVGTGPAGLFAGLILAEMGYCPIVLERGKDVDERSKDVMEFWKEGKLKAESNVQFGEGGAGTFSDGKLTTQIKDLRCRKVLKEFISTGAPDEILYHYKPHVGTDKLRKIVKKIRNKIIDLGGEVRFNSKVTDIIINQGKVEGIYINGSEKIDTEIVILAIGHSARDTFEMLYDRGIELQQKPFSIGVRIEHPQQLVNNSQYGQYATHPKLGAADYKLSYHCSNGRSAYTFCMCPGGEVVAAASEEGRLVTNGMSYHARDKDNANSALLVGVAPEDYESSHPLAGVYYQQRWEERAFQLGGSNYHAPVQLVGDFLKDCPSKQLGNVKPSYTPGVTPTDLRECLPQYVISAMKEAIIGLDKKLKGFALEDAVMTGVETRSSSPVRIIRNEGLISNIDGLYPAGEGAGYAGGIVSAAVDGIKAAEAVAKKYKPIKLRVKS
ncbi:NAD(P)/FAD-dependent oxidoreductase [Alkaliphilus peptidifermentans]|nr:hypothetical protein [Alkaliphilus peptidifermentans]